MSIEWHFDAKTSGKYKDTLEGKSSSKWPLERVCPFPGTFWLIFNLHLLFLHHSCFNTKQVLSRQWVPVLTIVQTWLDMERERVYEISGLFHHLFHDFQNDWCQEKNKLRCFLGVNCFRNHQRDGFKKNRYFRYVLSFPIYNTITHLLLTILVNIHDNDTASHQEPVVITLGRSSPRFHSPSRIRLRRSRAARSRAQLRSSTQTWSPWRTNGKKYFKITPWKIN